MLQKLIALVALSTVLAFGTAYGQDDGDGGIDNGGAIGNRTSAADNDDDKGWIGLAGLLGLAGLAGLMRRDNHDHRNTGTPVR